jgi:5'-nucleotidase
LHTTNHDLNTDYAMRILIANDDGIYSPGLLALVEAARSYGDVQVFAPDVEQSSMGHAITHSRPLSVKRTPIADFEAYRVNGTPADCVALGLDLWGDVDLVLSGINLGPNLGNSAWHSGTLAAAKQAALLGCRGVAFSTPTRGAEPDFPRLKPWVEQVLTLLIDDPSLDLVNVNLPHTPTGLTWTHLSVRHYDGHVVPGEDPMGRKHFWLTVTPVEEVEEGSDRWAMRNGLVSLTPMRLDLTDAAALARARERHPFDGAMPAAALPPVVPRS